MWAVKSLQQNPPVLNWGCWLTQVFLYNDRNMVIVVLIVCSETTTTVLWPFVRDYPGEPVPEETLTHPPSWSSSNLYQLLPSTMIHSILLVQITCLAIFVHNLSVSSLVYLLVWSPAPHIPYIPLPNQCLLFVAHAHTVCTESALKCERSNNLQ